ncbi:MAG: sulfate ABC transporter substrate-binding protein [Rhodocyclaceae bacterium]|nr:MAG: sulfate ABC transporter substrate-binding protein [Rhodocyclaceae bacterium]
MHFPRRTFMSAALLAGLALGSIGNALADTTLLNVSYDPTRELYQDYNAAFAKYWQAKTGESVEIKASHGGSGAQSRLVQDGLDADVVTLALAYDIDAISAKGLLAPDWQKKFKNNSTPFTSTIVLLVRKGNPKGIKDWADIAKPGIGVIVANPKTSGGARWAYLAAYGWALHQPGGNEQKANDYIKKVYANVPSLQSGARGATVDFAQRGLGDVLLSWENEADLVKREFGDNFDVVYPPSSILAEPPVAIVDKVVDKKGTRKVATEYLEHLYSPDSQEIAAKNGYRPTDATVLAKYAKKFPKLKLFSIDDTFGGWQKAQKTHFADGGVFDQIYEKK